MVERVGDPSPKQFVLLVNHFQEVWNSCKEDLMAGAGAKLRLFHSKEQNSTSSLWLDLWNELNQYLLPFACDCAKYQRLLTTIALTRQYVEESARAGKDGGMPSCIYPELARDQTSLCFKEER